MKIYNPLRPHICTDGENYGIRKWFFIYGFQYFDLITKDDWRTKHYIERIKSKDLGLVKKILPLAYKYFE